MATHDFPADLGASGFIRKPFEQAQVVDELREIAKTRRIVAQAATAPDGLPLVASRTGPSLFAASAAGKCPAAIRS